VSLFCLLICRTWNFRRSGFDSGKELDFISSSPTPDRLPRPCSVVTGALSPGVNRPGHKADHSPISSAEVKNASCLVKHRDNFALNLTNLV
jgi:hypothetical protein